MENWWGEGVMEWWGSCTGAQVDVQELRWNRNLAGRKEGV
jgi:hypothetical protein